MPESYRTSAGWIRVEHLRNGEVEQRGWRSPEGDTHVLTLRLERKRPELWVVQHWITASKTNAMSTNSELFNTLTEAREHFKSVRREPPTRYEQPEVA